MNTPKNVACLANALGLLASDKHQQGAMTDLTRKEIMKTCQHYSQQ
jgi:hypothetical protein